MSQMAEILKQKIQENINGKSFDDHENDVRRRNGSCRGNERWVHGQTGASSINVSTSGDGFDIVLTAMIEIPYSGRYKRKKFDRPIGCGYTQEDKNINGEYHWKITKSFFGITHEDLGMHSTEPSTAHDSTRMAGEAIREDIFSRLDNLA